MSHVYDARSGRKSALWGAMRKYGEENFVVEALAALLPGGDLDDLRLLERALIAQENTMCPHGYNLSSGGEGLDGRVLSDQARANMSAAQKGRPGPNKGKTFSLEWKAKLSEGQKVRAARERAAGIKRVKSGRAHTDEWRALMSEKMTGRKMSPEAIAKAVNGRWGEAPRKQPKPKGGGKGSKGFHENARVAQAVYASSSKNKAALAERNRSPEMRAKVSAARKAFWANRRAQNEVTH